MEESNTELKYLFLEKLHTSQGAKFGAFAGYHMPISYTAGMIEEHLHTRNHASIFDVSHMGQVHISGEDAENFIDRILPIPAAKLRVGRARYTVMLNEQGGIIDDLIITRKSPELFWTVLNAACLEKDLEHIRTQAKDFNVQIDFIEDHCLCAVQGREAKDIVDNLLIREGDVPLCSELGFMSGSHATYQGQDLWINRSGYTGEDGFELSIPHPIATQLISDMLNDDRVEFAGLGARNSLRLEAGLSLYGNDMDEATNVYEADLGFAVSKLRLEETDETKDFVGAKRTREAKQNIQRKKVGVLPSGKAPLREHVKVYADENFSGECIGEVCSGGFSPVLQQPIAFAYVDIAHAEINKKLWAELRGKAVAIEVSPLPFVAHKYYK